MGMVWTFVLILVEDIAGPSFTHIKLLQGVMLGVGIFLGEVPSLFLSGEYLLFSFALMCQNSCHTSTLSFASSNSHVYNVVILCVL